MNLNALYFCYGKGERETAMEFYDESGAFLSADGASSIRYYVWLPQDPTAARGVVQLVHGMAEHSGRYEHFARFLTRNGYIVCQHDHLGHGQSVDALQGYFGKHGAKTLVADTITLTGIIQKVYPGKPIILFGHSMGSFVARWAAAKSDNYDRLILSGTGWCTALIKLALLMVRVSILFKGDKGNAKLYYDLNQSTLNAAFAESRDGLSWLTRAESVRRAYESDPLCGFMFTLGGYRDLFSLMKYVNSTDCANKTNPNLPILLISGEKDSVGDFGKGVQKVFSLLGGPANLKRAMHLFPDCRHEILNEENKEEVYDYILGYLNS
jgi:alpha-beta hydrolase superfamily lysophospholipase